METGEIQVPLPRRSTRRLALSEVNESSGTPIKTQSPEERAILQRGRRCKPLIWSPLDYDRNNLLQKSADKTPEKPIVRTELISSRLKRRLILSPTKSKTQPKELGSFISSKLKMIDRKREEFDSFVPKKIKVHEKNTDDLSEHVKN